MAPTKRTVLITGCSEGGIGDALCQEFHRRGLRVFATARNLKKVQHLHAAGIETVQLDVVNADSIRKAVETVAGLTGGTLDILVNNSGSGYQMPLLDVDLDEARKLFDVNIWGLLAVTQAFTPLLAAAAAAHGRHARILNIGSVVSRASVPWQGIYNATKGALFILNDTLRLELRPFNIDVLHVVTGGVATNFYTNTSGARIPGGSMYGPVAAEVEKGVSGRTASKTQGCSPERYARVVAANTLSRWPTKTIWAGSLASIVRLGQYLGWDTARDYIIAFLWRLGPLRAKLAHARADTDAAAQPKP